MRCSAIVILFRSKELSIFFYSFREQASQRFPIIKVYLDRNKFPPLCNKLLLDGPEGDSGGVYEHNRALELHG